MMVTKEIIPSLKGKTRVSGSNALLYSVSEVKVYKNEHYQKGNMDVSHQYNFRLIGDDSIVYAASEIANEIVPAPFVIGFSTVSAPFIPADKMNSTYQLSFSKDVDHVLSVFPPFKFTDYLPKEDEYGNYLSRQVDVKQVSTDGKMMIYMVLKFQYDN